MRPKPEALSSLLRPFSSRVIFFSVVSLFWNNYILSPVHVAKTLNKEIYLSLSLSAGPRFTVPVANVSVAVGRDATLECVVDNIGDYMVS